MERGELGHGHHDGSRALLRRCTGLPAHTGTRDEREKDTPGGDSRIGLSMNWNLLKNPVNWLTVWGMVIIAGIALHFVCQLLIKEQE